MTALQVVDNNTDIVVFDDEKIELIKRTVAKGATDDELALFLHQAQKTGLDPLAKQIYFQKYNTKNGPVMAIITGIDGYRLVADRTNRYAGSSDAEYGETKSDKYYDTKFYYPTWARVTVRKFVKGVVCEFSASASWYEYYPGDKKGAMWRKMPRVMLAKCAEALALRKAFPADLSGVYTRDEMDQADYGDVPTTQPVIAATVIEAPTASAAVEDEIVVDTSGVEHAPIIDGPPAITDGQLKRLHALGKDLYGDDWKVRRAELVHAVSRGAAESSGELTTNEAKKLIDGMEAKIAERDESEQPAMSFAEHGEATASGAFSEG